jgi:uncharacterized protein YjiS (DUF1127 family)
MSCGSATHSRSAPPKVRLADVHVPSPFGWFPLVQQMHDRWRQRQALLDLDDKLLRDIGITRDQAEREARKPFWK